MPGQPPWLAVTTSQPSRVGTLTVDDNSSFHFGRRMYLRLNKIKNRERGIGEGGKQKGHKGEEEETFNWHSKLQLVCFQSLFIHGGCPGITSGIRGLAGHFAGFMAKNNTRMENLEVQVVDLVEQYKALNEGHHELKTHIDGLSHRLEDSVARQVEDSVCRCIEELFKTFTSPKFSDTITPHSTTPQQHTTRNKIDPGPLMPSPSLKRHDTHFTNSSKTPKFDFPKFTGKNPRQWIRKCHKFFLLQPYVRL
ncbi:hypothetical protein Salat_2710500 [Sesamum alatum]|uniref:Uncharacterized protein n=1 Tax=Sesamum alatum TaxID=300844 RepID=A0AAE2CBI7_9LAMI|nr:hypothetical protein Salat_2710500 [Sesamum alatum]